MIILSDVHGDISRCRQVCEEYKDQTVLQLGDLGVGFINNEEILNLPTNFRFFPGNHDDRDLSEEFNSCIGAFGDFENIFFVSGADSYDKQSRVAGFNWWPNEELSEEVLTLAVRKWVTSKAEILVSHDGPQNIVQYFFPWVREKSKTRHFLQVMIEARKPKQLIFGHHHKSRQEKISGIDCICLAINEILQIK